MTEYLFVSDAVPPMSHAQSAVALAGLAWGLGAAKHRVTILSAGAEDHVARLPGMARRLSKVLASVQGQTLELPLFEGRSAFGQAHVYVLGLAQPSNRGRTCAVLASAAAGLARDGIIKPDVVLAWGEVAAGVLASVSAASRLFVLPSGSAGPSLDAAEKAALGPNAAMDALSVDSLVALGAVSADAIVVPSLAAARQLESQPGIQARPSDEPIIALRFGCDDPPHDPATDPALPAHFTAESLTGKVECRKGLARRASLSLGPRTLLLATAPLIEANGGRALLETLPRLMRLELAVVIPTGGDRSLLDQANVLAIENPGKVAVFPDTGASSDRQILGGADALLLGGIEDLTGRDAGLAQRYGTLPIAPEAAAYADQLVDFDAASVTGSALLYSQRVGYDIEGAVRRAIALRANADVWPLVVRSLLAAAPRWSAAVSRLENRSA